MPSNLTSANVNTTQRSADQVREDQKKAARKDAGAAAGRGRRAI